MLVDVLRSHVDQPTPQNIASALSMLIRTGELAPGTRLPTVRETASALGISPATVSHAWNGLAKAGLVATRGRAGTFVLAPPGPWLPPRTKDFASERLDSDNKVRLDLAYGMPDPVLLPDIAPSLTRVAPHRASVSSYPPIPVLPELEQALRAGWPYEAPALTVIDGAMDGVERALRSVTRFGDRVIVESPTFPVLLDLLEHLRLMAVPVRMDHHGVVPGSLARALESRPAAVVFQPRAQNPTGASMTATRIRELCEMMTTHRHGRDVVIIEDDASALVAAAAPVSMGTWLPTRTIHVRGFSKSHGTDLRIGAISGPVKAIERIEGYRTLGPGWTSHLTQALLHDMLIATPSIQAVGRARYAYFMRQRDLTAYLRSHGIEAATADGLNAWVPVADERAARLMLAAHGIRVGRGSAFVVPTEAAEMTEHDGPHQGDHIRVGVGALRAAIPEVASAIARAARET